MLVSWSSALEQQIQQMKGKKISEHCQEIFILNQHYKSTIGSISDHNIQTFYGSNYVNFMSVSVENTPESHDQNRISNIRSSLHSASAASQIYMDNLQVKKEQCEWGHQTREEAAHNMQYFLTLTKLFEKHFKDEHNQLGQMCQCFVKQMINYDGELE
jgi:hypothetical protein